MNNLEIDRYTDADFDAYVRMATILFDEEDPKEIPTILKEILQDPRYEVFICHDDSGKAVGFLELSTRTDYVEGSSTSPVGYIEGIYLEKPFRGQGNGRKLVEYAEEWCKQKGYTELGSDTELKNEASQAFHKAAGFTAEPIVTFIKKV